MFKIIKKVLHSFSFAVIGMKKTFKSEFMFRFYIGIYVLAMVLAFLVKLPSEQWMLLIVCWSGVLSFELINTGVEKAVDSTSLQNDKTAFAKDAAAGSVALFGVTSGFVTLFLVIRQALLLWG